MRKTLLFCTLFFLQFIGADAQRLLTESVTPAKNKCNTFESMQDFRQKNPGAETDAQFEAWLAPKVAARKMQRTTVYYTVPIVFHIIHNGEAIGTGSNLSQAQIQAQLSQLNADYANLSGSTYSVAASTQIQFCLATIDNNGVAMAEPGIDRVDRNAKAWTAPPYAGSASNSYVDVTIIPGSIWNPNNFFNVWTIDLSGTLLGKATFPTGSTLAGLGSGETDTHAGVFVKYQSVGSICLPGTLGSSAGLGRTITHEAGHFFGLRHINGDAVCGDDYANDTPPQDALTSGCPAAGTLNNCTPSAPKMFENYMDYTDDACVNTFTADQVVRMQTVMANSPRRISLPGAASCNGPATNSIKFNYTCSSVSETRTVTSCPDYRDVLVNIDVKSSASGAATVTFTKSGTATDNVDYTIIPSSLTFANGESTPKTVTVRIWDDGVAESTETLVLGYTVSGSGVVAGTSNQTFSISITDNDQTPAISNTGSIQVFNENFEAGGVGWVAGQFISPAGLNVWTVGANGGAGISGNAAYITDNTTTKLNQYNLTSTSNTVFRSPLINGTGKFNAKLSFKYKCNGELIGNTLNDYGTIMYSLNGSSFSTLTDAGGIPIYLYSTTAATTLTNIDLPDALDNVNFYIGFRWVNNNNGTGNNPPLLVDDIVVSVAATGTEGEVSHTVTKNIFSGQDVYLLSGNDNQAIARITSPSANIGCLTATVSQAGSGQTNVTTNAGTFQRTQKVITLVPATATTTITHQTTLYFSSAELSVWGANKLNLKILQVQDGANLSGTLTSANAKLVTPTSAVEDVANGVISYTGNFTGFSQFMLVSPTFNLPVGLVTFEAQPSKKSIELSWRTAAERNNKGFHIERSTNGSDFTTIGWIAGVGTTNEASTYRYSDNFVQPNTVYYYRLNQVDIDNHSSLSNIRQAKIAGSGLVVTVSPNPVKGQMNVFVSGTTQLATINLINAKGQTVARWNKVEVSSPYTIDATRFAKGHYTVVISLPGEEITRQIIIQ